MSDCVNMYMTERVGGGQGDCITHPFPTSITITVDASLNSSQMEDCNDEEAQRKLSDGYNSTDVLDVSRQALGDAYDNLVIPLLLQLHSVGLNQY